MRRVLLAFVLSTSMACTGVKPPHQPTQAEVLALIADATFGIDYACYSEWLTGPACVIVYHILQDATAAVSGLQNGWAAAAKAVLQREESKLPPDNRIRPYLDAIISVL